MQSGKGASAVVCMRPMSSKLLLLGVHMHMDYKYTKLHMMQ